MVTRNQAWHVYDNGKFLAIVYFDTDCTEEYVRSSLINHDGYPPTIRIYRREHV